MPGYEHVGGGQAGVVVVVEAGPRGVVQAAGVYDGHARVGAVFIGGVAAVHGGLRGGVQAQRDGQQVVEVRRAAVGEDGVVHRAGGLVIPLM